MKLQTSSKLAGKNTFDLNDKLYRYTVKFDSLLGRLIVLENYCHRVFARLKCATVDLQETITLEGRITNLGP